MSTATHPPGLVRKCSNCVYVERLTEDGETDLRCGAYVPFWVPLPVHDYQSWVKPDDGKDCQVFREE